MMHATDISRLDKDRIDLATARAILADAPHHSDPEIKTACDTIMMLTRDPHDLRTAQEWLNILAHDP